MTDRLITTLAWMTLAVHIAVGVAALRSDGWRPWLPLLNLTIAACVLAYWVTRWYSYLFQGITWEASDQLFPLYAALVCALAIVSLSGRHHLATLNWIVFAIHGVVTIGAVLFVTFFKMRMF